MNVQNHGVVSQKLHNFATVREYQMPLGFLCTYEQVISVWNFALKFQAVAQKMPNNFRGYFFCRTLYTWCRVMLKHDMSGGTANYWCCWDMWIDGSWTKSSSGKEGGRRNWAAEWADIAWMNIGVRLRRQNVTLHLKRQCLICYFSNFQEITLKLCPTLCVNIVGS